METRATTTTDLGKVILTNGYEYNPEATYEKNTFVLFNNSTYLALQTITGVEPVNDLINWQLMAKGFAGDDFVADRYVFVDRDEESEVTGEPMIDADALGGNKPDFYAPQHEISDAFSTEKDYVIGDYCIYLNSLYRFINAKPAGAWDGAAVVPVTISGEMKNFASGIEGINGDLANISGSGLFFVKTYSAIKFDDLSQFPHQNEYGKTFLRIFNDEFDAIVLENSSITGNYAAQLYIASDFIGYRKRQDSKIYGDWIKIAGN